MREQSDEVAETRHNDHLASAEMLRGRLGRVPAAIQTSAPLMGRVRFE
jgi:hypothetical protein